MANAIPAVGSRISLVSSGDIRYEGILYSIDMVESKIALQQGGACGVAGPAPLVGAGPAPLELPWGEARDGAPEVPGGRRPVVPALRGPYRVAKRGCRILKRLCGCVWAARSEVLRHRGEARGRGAGPPERGSVRVHRLQR